MGPPSPRAPQATPLGSRTMWILAASWPSRPLFMARTRVPWNLKPDRAVARMRTAAPQQALSSLRARASNVANRDFLRPGPP